MAVISLYVEVEEEEEEGKKLELPLERNAKRKGETMAKRRQVVFALLQPFFSFRANQFWCPEMYESESRRRTRAITTRTPSQPHKT